LETEDSVGSTNKPGGGQQGHRSKRAHHSPFFAVEKVDPALAREQGCNVWSSGKFPASD
jgi:hypothetical protein